MAEGFEPYHVPQQSRRDKLRILSGHQNQQPSAAAGVGQGLLPLIYDIPSTACGVKVENANLMAQIMAASSSSSNNHLYIDPPQLNPSSIEGFLNYNNTPHPPQGGLRFLHDQSFPLSVVTHESNNNNNNSNRSGSGQALSLSLSSNNNHPTLPPQLDLNLQRYDINNSSIFTTPSKVITTGDVSGSRNSVPLGPFTGYASVLKGSRFLKPAQLLLEELCEVGRGISSFEKIEAADHYLFMDSPLESLCGTGIEDDPQTCTGNGSENRKKKSRLMSMLHEVCKRYKQYYQQMQAVVASFEAVAGVRNAAPFANLALKAMSKHFKYLKNTITDQLQFITEPRSTQIAREKDSTTLCFDNPLMGIQNERQLQNVGLVHDHHHQPVWRPQRGLPERAVTVLRAWLFEHFLHPYPTDTDKIMLAKQTGLSRNQVSNWFINARVRLWKPMVEEIHMLETRQAQKASHKEDKNADQRQNNAMASTNRVSCEKKITSSQKVEDFPSKRTRSDLTAIQTRNEGDMNLLPYDNSSRHPCLNVGHVSTGAGAGAGAGGTGGVSLTLGLHQNNNGIGLGDTFPINAARRFGLDSNNDGYVIGGIDARNRQFGREIIGGQLLHDFVG